MSKTKEKLKRLDPEHESHQKLEPKEYEMMGRQMEMIIASGYAGKRRLIVANFIKGIATGFGSVVGAALMLVLLLWVLSGLEHVPFIGDIFENAKQTIQNTTSVR